MFTFARVRCRPDISDLCGWYLEVGRDQRHLMVSLQERFGYSLLRAIRDPHCPGLGRVVFSSIPSLMARWCTTFQRLLDRHGAVLINRLGGMMVGGDVLERVVRDDLVWPDEDPEIITISRWAGGVHWYLSSSRSDRKFDCNGFKSVKIAKRAALQIVPEALVKIK